MHLLYLLLSSEQTQQQLDTAERELQVVMEARDDAVLKMTNAQEQARQNAAALRNLQAVLEEFQRGIYSVYADTGEWRMESKAIDTTSQYTFSFVWG